MDSTFRLLDESVKKEYATPLKLVLLTCRGISHLPEIFEIFGEESALKFLDIFAGCTIEVPSRKDIQTTIRDVVIWATLTKHKGKKRRVLVEELCAKYSQEKSTLFSVKSRVQKTLKDFGIAEMAEGEL